MNWILRGIIGFLVVCAAGIIILWGLGYRPGHGSFETSILINQPRPIVYAALTDDDMTKKWVSGIIELKKLTPDPMHVGTKILLTETINGDTVVMEEEVSELQPPRIKKYISRGIGDPSIQFIEFGEYELEDKEGQTLFTMRSHIQYHGWLYKLLEPLLTFLVRHKFSGDQKRLKDILENSEKMES